MSATNFVRAYFSGRYAGLSPEAATEAQFLGNISEKINHIVDNAATKLSSALVQSLYARLRLRFWQGKNNSVDNHIGYAVTPFSEHRFSVPAMWVPVSAKRDGWFERQMIRAVSRNLARYPSSHGYNLEHGPGAAARARSFVTSYLPTWLRTRRRRMSQRRNRYYFQGKRYVAARFGSSALKVGNFVDVSQLGDALSFSRALTVERMLRGEWL
jgi:hypothetical protein